MIYRNQKSVMHILVVAIFMHVLDAVTFMHILDAAILMHIVDALTVCLVSLHLDPSASFPPSLVSICVGTPGNMRGHA